ncbi:MAG: hypothetical protein OXI43_04890 [Candidatus Poribacteria bacterium]|nr:hypothetical protein [Candidatus Poribacteria bacterium]
MHSILGLVIIGFMSGHKDIPPPQSGHDLNSPRLSTQFYTQDIALSGNDT